MQNFEVELPAGGRMFLQSDEEVELWERSAARYVEDYHLTKTNDLVLVGAILQQQLILFRAQRALNGLEPILDNAGVPTGQYRQIDLDARDTESYLSMLTRATDQIQKIEKQLGIDKVSRESGGAVTVEQYLTTLKRAAHERGVHISRRTLAYERFVNELRWKVRILLNADTEDRAYHDLTPEKLIQWASEELKSLEDIDKRFAQERGKLYVGRL